jgi:hypothetical protein
MISARRRTPAKGKTFELRNWLEGLVYRTEALGARLELATYRLTAGGSAD